MPRSQETLTGELCIYGEAILWSLFPVITILSLSTLTPILSAGLSTLTSSLFFASILTLKGRWHEIAIRSAWKPIFLTTLFIGIIFYALFFLGLRSTTAGNASIMALMEVFFSFLILACVWKKEPFDVVHIFGALAMAIGALLILSPKAAGWHRGDLLIMAATAFAPVGNHYTQQARKIVSAEMILFLRSLISGLFLIILALMIETPPSTKALTDSAGFIAINGTMLLGLSKILWIEGAHRLPITKAISLSSIAPLFTLIFAYFLLGERITLLQIGSLLPIFLGVHLLTKQVRGRAREDPDGIF